METIVSTALPVDERLTIYRQRYGVRGRRISIVTGIHGDELEGQYVCYEVARRIKAEPERLKGIVDLYPAMNPNGISTVMRGIPAFDLDMDRIFPGRGDGDMNEFIASEIIEDVQGSDLVLDIHAGGHYMTEAPQIRINELFFDQLLPLAKMANVDLVWKQKPSTVQESTFAHALNTMGTPTMVVRMGAGARVTRAYGDQLTEGVFRLMGELGIWQGEKTAVKEPIVSEKEADVFRLNALRSGVFLREAEHGAMVRKGERIGCIVDPPNGEILCEVVSPVDGWLFSVREFPMVSAGSLMARVLGSKAFGGKTR